MATYVCLLDWTQKGIENVKDSPKRLDASREIVKAAGGEIRDVYMTIGKHDMVLVVETKDDAALAKGLLKIAAGHRPDDDDASILGGGVPRDSRRAVAAELSRLGDPAHFREKHRERFGASRRRQTTGIEAAADRFPRQRSHGPRGRAIPCARARRVAPHDGPEGMIRARSAV